MKKRRRHAVLWEKPDNEVVVGRQYSAVITLACINAFLIWMFYKRAIENGMGYIAPSLGVCLLLFGFVGYVRNSFYYGVSEHGLTEYFFGKQIRQIPWSSVVQIGTVHPDGRFGYLDFEVLVTLKNAPKYPFPGHNLNSYVKCCRPDVLLIRNANKPVKHLEEFYGPLDYYGASGKKYRP